ncbi:MAG: hypothetical protein H7Z21_08855 [Hymenobacter sp.]|nr:hypothetical protein [Hymenobacter sp.]
MANLLFSWLTGAAAPTASPEAAPDAATSNQHKVSGRLPGADSMLVYW